MNPPDPAVRSVRIATTLNERFRDLMHQPSSPGDGTAELELRIGEAQQIYPEIWNHLDDARKVIAERGGDTKVYDAIKANQGPARLGVTRVDVDDHDGVGFAGYGPGQIKEAHFNLEGFRAAHKACAALMAAMPEVDWKAVERAENQEIAAAGSLGPISSKKTLRWLVIAAALVALTYGFWFLVIRIPPVDPAEREAKLAADREQRVEEFTRKLAANPCDYGALQELTWALSYAKPPGQDRAAEKQYRAECAQKVTEMQTYLDANPCDDAKLAELTAAVGVTKPKTARAATAKYRDLCEASKSAPPAPP